MNIGPVHIIEELGTGAGSRVFRVTREEDEGDYALKVVRAGTPATRKFLKQVTNEFHVGGLLDHPNLLKTLSLETDEGWFSGPTQARLLSEFVPGRTMDRLPRLSVPRLLRVFERIADALAHMHARGVTHADLKPNNLILGPGTAVKLIDFGLSRTAGGAADRLQGTPEFMAPETAAHKVVDARSELYTFGATMFWLVTFRHPPPAAEALIRGERWFARQLSLATDLDAHGSRGLADLIRGCLGFRPEQRPAGMDAVRGELNALAAAEGVGNRPAK